MFIEKYKPRTFDDFNYHHEIINTIKNNLHNIQNMLFFGPPGCGKTTLANIIVNTIYIETNYKSNNCLKLNASDERGIDTIKNKVKDFCTKSVYGSFKFKIIIFDEADMLTIEAQTSLRKIMEDYTNTKFILICNYEDKIINPILSRCLKFSFSKIPLEYMQTYLRSILDKEKCTNYEIIDIIIKYTNGDLRKSIILLEIFSKASLSKNNIHKLLGIVDINDLKIFLDSITEKTIFKKTNEFIRKSYPLKNFMDCYKKIILTHEVISDKNKKKMLIDLSNYDSNIYYNVDQEILLLNIFSDYIKYSRE